MDETAEVEARRGEDNICGITGAVGEMIAAHAVFGFEMSVDRFDSGTPSHLALDLRRHSSLLTRGVDPELVIGRRITPSADFLPKVR